MLLASSNPAPTLSDAEFRMFADLVRSHCGLNFSSDLRYLLEKRLTRRMAALGLDSFASYHYLLRHESSGDEEFARLVDELTTNETYFMRERNQLRALIEEILPELCRRRRVPGPVTLWSAGCASGEEPYSIAMLALEAGFVPGTDFRLYASDISRVMLERARRGEYRPGAFREMEPELRQRYFDEQGGIYRISDRVKRHVRFAHVNLLDQRRISLLGPMDVILCRNVIIYFQGDTKRDVIHAFEQRLRPGGYLLLGHSESLISLSNAFELRHLRNDMVYRKPGAGESVASWHGSSAPEPEPEPESRASGGS